MQTMQPVREVIDLTDSTRNLIFNMTLDEARERVASGDPKQVREIDGQFALVGRKNHLVRLARTLAIPLRYFMAKKVDGPTLVVAHRMDAIAKWLGEQGLADQFHPTYTRMVPAHYITEIALVGCPDPNPVYNRYFTPQRESLSTDLDEIGRAYVGATADQITKWLERIPNDAPIGVCFSGGIDSGAVFLLTYHLLLKLGQNPSRLKAFTLSVEGSGDDLDQSRRFLESLDLTMFHEPVEVPESWIDYAATVRLMEDYKPLDVQAGAMMLALCRGIRQRYPQWRYLLDGDGGDENLKDYPIEENPELTIKSVLNNRMLYQEGWGVESLKHSLVYSGGLSRASTRSFAPTSSNHFETFSPFMSTSVIEVAEGIGFIELTDWQHDRLYKLKGEIVSRGIEAVTGLTMPVFEKRRFQHGTMTSTRFHKLFPDTDQEYRRAFDAAYSA